MNYFDNFIEVLESIIAYGVTIFENLIYEPQFILALPFLFSFIAFIIYEIYRLIKKVVYR